MSDIVRVLLVIAIIVYVIGRQVIGEPLRGKRVVLLPVVLTVIGAVDLFGHTHHAGGADVVLLLVNAGVAAGIGLALGRSMRLENRDGYLWGQLPVRALWLWLGLVVSRVVLTGIADAAHASVAASGAAILLILGINRLAQAAVVLPRAMSAGIPFAPEKDGNSFLGGLVVPGQSDAGLAGGSGSQAARPIDASSGSGRPDWSTVSTAAQQIVDRLEQRRRAR